LLRTRCPGLDSHKETHDVTKYELIFIVHPDRTDEEARKVADRVREVVAREGGEILKAEEWGKRKLAYEIKKQGKGSYFLVHFAGTGRVVSEVERTLRISDDVLKYLTVLLDEKAAAAAAAAPAAPAAPRRSPDGEDLGDEAVAAALAGADADVE
jgi:small subunit ribosomal protein S6